ETSDGTYYAMGWIHTGAGVCGGYVYKSVDSGATWDTTAKIRRGEVLSVRVYTMVEDLSGTIYAGFQPAYDSVVYASDDGGNSWYFTGRLDGAFECLTLLRASNGTIYAGTTPNGDVFKYVPTGVEKDPRLKAKVFGLNDVYPNPFFRSTVINYQLPVASKVSLRIYDLSGRPVKTLVDEWQISGNYRVSWDGKDKEKKIMPSGIYFVKFQAGEFLQTKKLLLLR
ncbi:MAG: T9SS type A sorting domain-containing protein, partial [Candidatus Stahlbacteria bacterium]|nr:T9SS type A sorting domain-containing protein [Candidatus Stahlbacteria bacterium]